MGLDDRDEGGDGCPEHVWEIRGVTFAADGAHQDQVCTRCGAVLVVGPDELTGRV